MAVADDFVWDENETDLREATLAEIADGFNCGRVDLKELHNWLFHKVTTRLFALENEGYTLPNRLAADPTRLADGTDLDTIIEPGFYALGFSHTSSTAGAPFNISARIMQVHRNANNVVQFIFDHDSPSIIMRRGRNVGTGTEAWSTPWERFLTSDDLADLQKQRLKVTRLFDDSNPTVAYPGGTSIANGTVTHTHVYPTAFPGEETKITVLWTTAIRVNSNSDNWPFLFAAVTLDDGTFVTNREQIGFELSNSDDVGYLSVSVGSSGSTVKGSEKQTVTFQQRTFMSSGGAASSTDGTNANFDNFGLVVIEELV